MTTEEKPLETSAAAANETPTEGGAANGEAPAVAAAPESDLERVTGERDKAREQLLRTAADFDNYRKRMRREVEDAKIKGQQDVVRDLLPVFDNLERAVQAAAQTTTDASSVVEGVRMVLKLFEDTAERIGLARIKTVGERFDPAIHEAIQQKEAPDVAPGTILNEVVPGYRFGEKLVRAAMVVVARKPAESKKSDAPPAVEPAAPEGQSDGDNQGKGA